MTERVYKKLKQSTLLGLSASLWFELFFKPYLSIESGARLASTCSFFWNSERIQEWLQAQKKQVFGPIAETYWNKLEVISKGVVIYSSIRFFIHTGRFGHLSHIYFGVFSSKERLLQVFNSIIDANVLLENPGHTYSFGPTYFCVNFATEDPLTDTFVRVSNVVKEEFEAILLFVKNVRRAL